MTAPSNDIPDYGSSSPSILDSALAYAARGWHIFPVDHPELARCAGIHRVCDGQRGKHPVVKWGTQHSTDPADLAAWFTGNPRNIGIACGPSNLLIVDEDAPGAYEAWALAHGHQLPDTYTVATGNGRHYYYTAPDRLLGNHEGPFRDEKINIRGIGGYVVAAESLHETGAIYTADNPHATVAPCPEWLNEALHRAAPTSGGTGTVEAVSEPYSPHRGHIPVGRRHHDLVSFAGYLRELGLPRSLAEPLMEQRWRDCEQPEGNPYPLEVARGDLYDVYRRYPPGTSTPAEPIAHDPLTGDDAVRAAFPALDWHALWADDTEEEWIVQPLLPARRLIAIYSAPKTGKSLLMQQLAAAVASGRPVLGHTPEPRRVLYVDFENDPRIDVRDRYKAMGYQPGDLGNLVYLSYPGLAYLDSAAGAAQLLAAADTYNTDVIVIDTVSRAIHGEENDNDTWLSFYRHTGLALKQSGRSLIRLDHTGKDPTKGQRGGSAKAGDVDAVWHLTEIARDKTYRLDCDFNRMPVPTKTLVVHRRSNPLRHELDGRGERAAFEARVTEVVDHLDQLRVPDNTGRNTAREHLAQADIKARNNVVEEAVRRRRRRALSRWDDDL